MKKSDFLAERGAAWDGGGCTLCIARVAYLQYSVEAAEAAGVVWDPEEPKLAERICVFGSPGKLVVDDDGEALNYRELHEAVRRYNAWEEIRRLASLLSPLPVYNTETIRQAASVREALLNLLKGETNG